MFLMWLKVSLNILETSLILTFIVKHKNNPHVRLIDMYV